VGFCRLPKSWKLEWHDGREWKPVETKDGFGVERDKFNKVSFTPVTAAKLRLVVQLAPEFSGGILEWRVK
jgi:hypothetical protein